MPTPQEVTTKIRISPTGPRQQGPNLSTVVSTSQPCGPNQGGIIGTLGAEIGVLLAAMNNEMSAAGVPELPGWNWSRPIPHGLVTKMRSIPPFGLLPPL